MSIETLEKKIKNILIIEDDEDHAFLEKDILEEDLNVEAKIIASGNELEDIYLHLFDIVLLDFNLPDTNGTEVLDMIRKKSDIPVILITGQSESYIAVETLKKGADDFLVKSPDTINMLPAVVLKVYNEHFRKKELIEKQRATELMQARVETLSQTLTTLAHYINNSTTTIYGYAQLCEHNPDSLDKSQKLVKVCIKETKRITNVIKELENLVMSMDIKTTNYVNIPDAMFAIEERLKEKLEQDN
ncbi:MAG: response regulator [Calditrichia bacterium]|nr:response regulator [Calditrichia bacterium]